MDSEQLIRQIMAEVMANLGKDNVTFAKNEPAPATGGARIDKSSYPWPRRCPTRCSGHRQALSTYTYARSERGLTAEDFRIAPATWRCRPRSPGPSTTKRPATCAGQQTAVPDASWELYNPASLPSTKAELYGIAEELESKYQCRINAAFIREAADVYEKRGRLKAE